MDPAPSKCGAGGSERSCSPAFKPCNINPRLLQRVIKLLARDLVKNTKCQGMGPVVAAGESQMIHPAVIVLNVQHAGRFEAEKGEPGQAQLLQQFLTGGAVRDVRLKGDFR